MTNKIIIELLESTDVDGIRNRVETLLEDNGVPVIDVRLDPADTSSQLKQVYERLIGMHMDTLLTHGAQVAQGLALAIVTIAQMYPEVQEKTDVQ